MLAIFSSLKNIKIKTKFAALFVLLMPVGAIEAQVLHGKISMEKAFANWNSYILTIANEKPTSRIASSSLDMPVTLAFDMRAPQCRPEVVLLVSLTDPIESDVIRSDVSISLRADTGPRFDLPATSYASMGDTTAMIFIDAINLEELILEMKKGSILRIKASFGKADKNPSYMAFSLQGFTAAHTRMGELCQNYLRKPSGQQPRNENQVPKNYRGYL